MRAALALTLVLAGCATSAETLATARAPIAVQPDPTATDWERHCAEAAAGPPQAAELPPFVRVPHVVREVLAAYPLRACLEGREGDVAMRVYVTADGAVENVQVVGSAGADFDDAAVDAIGRFRFSPACTAAGRPVPVWIVYRYKFRRGGGCGG
jgi:TonB family protein